MRWAFKFAYLGRGFHGYQRQPGLRTVEGDILDTLQMVGAMDDPSTGGFQSASRTDRGVSALGNVVAFETHLHPRKVISVANKKLENVWLYGFARVPSNFNPRHAKERWYRYTWWNRPPVGRLRRASQAFMGTHDFTSFSKNGEGGPCTISSISIHRLSDCTQLDVKADRFLWSMVRRIVRALEVYMLGELSLLEIRDALRGGSLSVEPAPPEPLCLMDVSYGFDFSLFKERSLHPVLTELSGLKKQEGLVLNELLRRLQ